MKTKHLAIILAVLLAVSLAGNAVLLFRLRSSTEAPAVPESPAPMEPDAEPEPEPQEMPDEPEKTEKPAQRPAVYYTVPPERILPVVLDVADLPETYGWPDTVFPEMLPNAIDRVFARRMADAIDTADERIFILLYYDLWKQQFDSIMAEIRVRLAANGNEYQVDEYIAAVESVQAASGWMMLEAFNEFSLGHNETGGGTMSGTWTHYYRGMMYRNACCYFLKFLPDYALPTEAEMEARFPQPFR